VRSLSPYLRSKVRYCGFAPAAFVRSLSPYLRSRVRYSGLTPAAFVRSDGVAWAMSLLDFPF